ncbi:MAG TPA: S41 family peptidase, partial [Tenuifilaceae bacterium]|nr:S41 family peptidase [Tenuifilaceae bacterium]
KPLDTTIPLAILVDRASASASEIVAGALQDLDRAIIIGERTFGKGLVQATRPLPYNTQVKITTAKYYIPSGRCIQAVDFTQRNEDGSISYIPDSLINEFTTKNGRIVYDGGGITPDILIEQSYYSRIASILYTNNYFFEYATIYHYGNRGKDVYPRNFKLSEREYDVFIDFLKTKNFKYQSQTEQILQDLTQAAKSENYLETIQPLIDSLQGVIELNRMNDFDLYKKEIKALLEEEIVSRYSFQRGRTEYEVSNDSIIQLSTDILRNKARYNEILTTGVN